MSFRICFSWALLQKKQGQLFVFRWAARKRTFYWGRSRVFIFVSWLSLAVWVMCPQSKSKLLRSVWTGISCCYSHRRLLCPMLRKENISKMYAMTQMCGGQTIWFTVSLDESKSSIVIHSCSISFSNQGQQRFPGSWWRIFDRVIASKREEPSLRGIDFASDSTVYQEKNRLLSCRNGTVLWSSYQCTFVRFIEMLWSNV